jgi:hypothetical protein
MPDPGASPPPGHDVASALEGRLGAAATRKWLDREGWHYELIEHEPTFRARDEALASGTEPSTPRRPWCSAARAGFCSP